MGLCNPGFGEPPVYKKTVIPLSRRPHGSLLFIETKTTGPSQAPSGATCLWGRNLFKYPKGSAAVMLSDFKNSKQMNREIERWIKAVKDKHEIYCG